ncbi:MAG: phosphoribosylanthranilate isomerase [Acidobacteriota bacterium]
MIAKVKICGITNPRDARAAADAGASFLGLNFYPRSPRFIDATRACEIADAVRGQVKLVGVFVNSTAEEVTAIDQRVGLDLLQFHGDESPAFVAQWGRRGLPAVRWRDANDARRVREHPRAWGVLVERRDAVLYGGTGESWDYSQVAPLAAEVRLVLAGGLGPDNVREALRSTRAYGVDVCSRVESAPGIKDERLMRLLMEEIV